MLDVRECATSNSSAAPAIAVVSHLPGSGWSTVAPALASAVGVPAKIRDEVEQGVVLASTRLSETGFDDLNIATVHAFFDTLTMLSRAGVSAVAGSAFQDEPWFYTRSPVVVR